MFVKTLHLSLACCASAVLIAPVLLPAQETRSQARGPGDEIPFAPYAPPTFMWVNWPSGAMYEGDINIPLHLYSRTRDLANPDSAPGANIEDCLRIPVRYRSLTATKLVTGCTLTFTPHFVIRQLKSASAPVQTPTFNPGLEFNWHRLALEPGAADGQRTAVLRTLHFRYAHYSNGQSGCLSATQVPRPDGSCEGEFHAADPLNTKDGSFSTNYAEVGVTRAWVTYMRGAERWLHGPSLAVRVHVPFPPGQMEPTLAEVYGRASVLGGYLVRKRGSFRAIRVVSALRSEGECAFQRAPQYQPCRANVVAMLSFPGAYGFGVAAKYSAGFDYYNVGFGQSHSSFALALMFDHTRAMAISDAARRQIAR